MIQTKTDEIADDAPGTFGKVIKIVPALPDGGSAVEPIAIDVYGRAFELYHGAWGRFFAGLKQADSGVGLAAIDGEFRFEVPMLLIFRE